MKSSHILWLIAVVASFVIGLRVDHEMKRRHEGVYNYVVSGGSMYPTFDSGDELMIRDLRPREVLKTDTIIRFRYGGDDNVKRLKALAGQVWEGRLVPEGMVAIAGDCKYTTDPNLPAFIPSKDVVGVVVAVRYAELWQSPEGRKEPAPKIGATAVVPAEQEPLQIDGVKIVRVDKNASSLTDIGIVGDLRSYYKVGCMIIEESTAKVYRVKEVGFDPMVAGGMTRLLTVPQFGSWTNDGRVALLARGQGPPKDVASVFRKLN